VPRECWGSAGVCKTFGTDYTNCHEFIFILESQDK